MSNPLKRRMAKVAIVVAAGTAPVIAGAGAANAVSLPPATDLGGLTNLDADQLGHVVDGAAQAGTGLAGEVAGDTVKDALPAGGQLAGAATRTAAPAVQETAGTLAGGTGNLLSKTAGATGDSALPAADLPTGPLQTPLNTGNGLLGGLPLPL